MKRKGIDATSFWNNDQEVEHIPTTAQDLIKKQSVSTLKASSGCSGESCSGSSCSYGCSCAGDGECSGDGECQ